MRFTPMTLTSKALSRLAMRCPTLPMPRMQAVRQLTTGVRTVIIADHDLLSKHTESCCEILRSCATDGRGVILIDREPLPACIAEMVSREFHASFEADRPGMVVISEAFGTEAWRIDSGKMQALPDSEKQKHLPAMTQSSYDPGRFKELPDIAARLV